MEVITDPCLEDLYFKNKYGENVDVELARLYDDNQDIEMDKAVQKSILRQGMKRIKRLGLGKFCRPRLEMFELYKLRQLLISL